MATHRAVVGVARQLADRHQERHEERRVVVGQRPLHHGGDALEPHARIDRRRGQRRERALGIPLELHEHVVPDLDETFAARFHVGDEVAGTGDARSAVDINFRAASARTGIAHGPEVVGHAELANVIGGHEIEPPLVRFVVAGNAFLTLEDRDVERGRVEFPLLRQQVPGQLDGVVLEVIPEREVAEHLEERVMPQGGPDVVEIVMLAADAHALLRRRRARVVALLAAQEHVLELVHPGVREEQGRIVAGQQGTAGDAAVAVLLEVVQERTANFPGMHLFDCNSPLELLQDRLQAEALCHQAANEFRPAAFVEVADRLAS